jgi:hypothetical protein
MMSLKVTWTFLSTLHVTTMVGDNCIVGLEARKVGSSEVRSWRGKRVWEPTSLKPRNSKSRNPENFDDGRTTVDFILWRMSKCGPLIHLIS